MATTTRDRLVTNPTQEQAVRRMGELMAEYGRMTGVVGDELSQTVASQYTGLLADALHYADAAGMNAFQAIADAVTVYLEEKSGRAVRR